MKYNVQKLEEIASELSQMVTNKPNEQIGQVESNVFFLLQALGQAVLRHVIEAKEPQLAKMTPCPCGAGTQRNKGRRKATIISIFGTLRYERNYYHGCKACKTGYIPVDRELGLQAGKITAGLADILAKLGVVTCFREAAKLLEELLYIKVAPNTIRSASLLYGKEEEARELEQIASVENGEDVVHERPNSVVSKPKYASIDGAFFPTIAETETIEKESKTVYKEVKTMAFYEAEQVLTAQRTQRQRKNAEKDGVVQKAENIQYCVTTQSASELRTLFWAKAEAFQLDESNEVVFICDGAQWIWKLIEQYFPKAVQILDWYHAEEKLEKFAAETIAFDQREDWLFITKELLWTGKVDLLLKKIRAYSGQAAQLLITYFDNNRLRINYAEFQANGYFVGSGIVESACKQIVAQRMKRSGARWRIDNGNLIMKARAAWLSDNWNRLTSRVAHTFQFACHNI